MPIIRIFCLFLFSLTLHAQSDTTHILKRYSVHSFKQAGLDLKTYQWNNANEIGEINIAEHQFRISKGLLGAGIAASSLGSASIIYSAMKYSSHNSLTPQTTPFLITGIALDIIVMPICFVVREHIREKAMRHIQQAKTFIQ